MRKLNLGSWTNNWTSSAKFSSLWWFPFQWCWFSWRALAGRQGKILYYFSSTFSCSHLLSQSACESTWISPSFSISFKLIVTKICRLPFAGIAIFLKSLGALSSSWVTRRGLSLKIKWSSRNCTYSNHASMKLMILRCWQKYLKRGLSPMKSCSSDRKFPALYNIKLLTLF